MTVTYLSPEEVADRLPICLDTVYKKLQQGRMPGYKVGVKWVVLSTELEEWVKAQPRPRQRHEDPMPAPRRSRFREKVVSLETERARRSA